MAALLLSSAAIHPQQLVKIPPRYGHLLYLPKGMWKSKKKYPLILYLHGRSLRGYDLSKVSSYGLPRRLRTDRSFPFIVVAPQLPDGLRWTDTTSILDLVNSISRWYPVDRARVYAVGFSMGASGVWRVAHAQPSRFAALVSVGGTYEKPLAQSGKLKDIPVWIIHGDADKEVPVQQAKEQFEAFRKAGGKGELTLLPGKGHDIPGVLEKGDIYHWLLKYHK